MANTAWFIMGRMSLLWGGAPNQKCFYHLNLFISALDSEICIGYFAITSLERLSQNSPTISWLLWAGQVYDGKRPQTKSVFIIPSCIYPP